MKNTTLENRLRDLGLFRLEKTRQRGSPISIHSHLMAIYIFGRTRFFSEVHTKRTWEQYSRFLVVDIRKEGKKSHHRLPIEVAESLPIFGDIHHLTGQSLCH